MGQSSIQAITLLQHYLDELEDEPTKIEFHKGVAAVKSKGKWGYINTDFQTVIPFEFEYATNFQSEFALVYQGQTTEIDPEESGIGRAEPKWGVIDLKGNVVLEPEHSYEDASGWINNKTECKPTTYKIPKVIILQKKQEQIHLFTVYE